jgi:hypothetical protein
VPDFELGARVDSSTTAVYGEESMEKTAGIHHQTTLWLCVWFPISERPGSSSLTTSHDDCLPIAVVPFDISTKDGPSPAKRLSMIFFKISMIDLEMKQKLLSTSLSKFFEFLHH